MSAPRGGPVLPNPAIGSHVFLFILRPWILCFSRTAFFHLHEALCSVLNWFMSISFCSHEQLMVTSRPGHYIPFIHLCNHSMKIKNFHWNEHLFHTPVVTRSTSVSFVIFYSFPVSVSHFSHEILPELQ